MENSARLSIRNLRGGAGFVHGGIGPGPFLGRFALHFPGPPIIYPSASSINFRRVGGCGGNRDRTKNKYIITKRREDIVESVWKDVLPKSARTGKEIRSSSDSLY